MEYLVIGIVTAINLIIIIMKIKKSRYQDATLDVSLFLFVLFIFSGTYSGMVVGVVASMVVSIYLYSHPPSIFLSQSSNNNGAILLKRTIAAAKNLDVDGPMSSKYDEYGKL
jgi:hypothetical protein